MGGRTRTSKRARNEMHAAELMNTLIRFGISDRSTPTGFSYASRRRMLGGVIPVKHEKDYSAHPAIKKFVERMYQQWILPVKR